MTTQPSLSAAIIAALGLTGTEEVFEVGTGYGYQTALLARLAARVISIDIWPDLAAQARRNLAAQGIGNVVVQLKIGGRLVQPVGPGGAEHVVLYQKERDSLRRVRIVTAASFVQLHGRHGFPRPEP